MSEAMDTNVRQSSKLLITDKLRNSTTYWANVVFHEWMHRFADILRRTNYQEIDNELAWAHGLTTGDLKNVSFQEHQEKITQYRHDHIRTILTDLHAAMVEWILIIKEKYKVGFAFDQQEIYLGYTIRLPQHVRIVLENLIKIANSDTTLTGHALSTFENELDLAYLSVRDSQRRQLDLLKSININVNGHTEQKTGETRSLAYYADPLLRWIQQDELNKYLEGNTVINHAHYHKYLKICGQILKIVNYLSPSHQDKLVQEYKPITMIDGEQITRENMSDEIHRERWIDHLPSYRPEFLLSLKSLRVFEYPGSNIPPKFNDSKCLKYLRALVSLNAIE